jgi:hypothetical protein
MKTRNIILAGLILLLVPGCLVKSLHPFYNENEVIYKSELLGNWSGADSSTWKIEEGMKSQGIFKPVTHDKSYKITYTDKSGPAVFKAHLFKLAGHLFLDFYPEDVESSNDMMASHLVPMHTVARVDLQDGRIMIRWYNEEWLIGLFTQNKIRISHEKIPIDEGNDRENNYQVILTASTAELQKFILKYSDDKEAFKSEYTFQLTKVSHP